MYEVRDVIVNKKIMFNVTKDGEPTGWYSPFKSEMEEMARINNERDKDVSLPQQT